MFKVEIIDEVENLPEEIKEDYEYSVENCRSVLVVTHNGKIVFSECDGGEPEDQSFGRDLGWVKGAIEDAYKLGLTDAI